MNIPDKAVEEKLIRDHGMFYLSAGESFKRQWREAEARRMEAKAWTSPKKQ